MASQRMSENYVSSVSRNFPQRVDDSHHSRKNTVGDEFKEQSLDILEVYLTKRQPVHLKKKERSHIGAEKSSFGNHLEKDTLCIVLSRKKSRQ